MEYDKKLISLYEKNNALPKAFLTIYKRADEVVILLSQKCFNNGVLCFYSDGKYFYADINRQNQQINLNDLNFYGEIYVYLCNKCGKLFSKNLLESDNKNSCLILEKFNCILNKLAQEKKEQLLKAQDRNFVVDSITFKMFGFLPLEFYNQAKNQLYSLFSTKSRAECIEKIIPCSKFIKSGKGKDEIFAGVIYRENNPYAVAIGFWAGSERNKPVHENTYQYFYQSSNEKEGYFLSFRRASDEDIVWI